MMTNKGNTIQQVRSEVLDSSLLAFSWAVAPAIVASLARVSDFGWQSAMICQLVVVVLLWAVTLGRQYISFQLKSFLLLGCAFTTGTITFWSFGLIGGGVWLFFVTTVLATILYGARWGWLSLLATFLVMSLICLAVFWGYIDYSIDFNLYAIHPAPLVQAVLATVLLLAIITAALGKFHTSLLTLVAESEARAARLDTEIIERQKVEHSRAEDEKKFHQIVDNFKDVYFETSLDGIIIYCSKSCLEFSGYSQDELLGKEHLILCFQSQPDIPFTVEKKCCTSLEEVGCQPCNGQLTPGS